MRCPRCSPSPPQKKGQLWQNDPRFFRGFCGFLVQHWMRVQVFSGSPFSGSDLWGSLQTEKGSRFDVCSHHTPGIVDPLVLRKMSHHFIGSCRSCPIFAGTLEPRHDPWDCHICRSVGVVLGGQCMHIYHTSIHGVSGESTGKFLVDAFAIPRPVLCCHAVRLTTLQATVQADLLLLTHG